MQSIHDYKIYNPKCLLCNKRLMKTSKKHYISFACKKCVSSSSNKILDTRFKFQVKFIKNNNLRELFSIVRRSDDYKLIYKKNSNTASLLKYDKNNYTSFIMEVPIKLFLKFLNMPEPQLINTINTHLLFL